MMARCAPPSIQEIHAIPPGHRRKPIQINQYIMYNIARYLGMGGIGLLGACAVYNSRPIDLETETSQWEQTSRSIGNQPVNMHQARQIGLTLNPELNKARLKLANSSNAAIQAGWWNDPSFSWDVQQVLNANHANMAGDLSFTIPVTGLPALARKVAEQYKEADFWALRQKEQEFLTSLDQAWSELSMSKLRQSLIRERLQTMQSEADKIEKLVNAGEADFATRQLAAQRFNDATRELQTVTEAEQEQKLALLQLMGLHATALNTLNFINDQNFSIPAAVSAPSPAALAAAPGIKAQLASYATTETLLKTEIRKQYPELRLGPSFTRDDGENELGPTFGFDIPLWNRNRKAIAESGGARDSTRLETVQAWRASLFKAEELAANQKLVTAHCRAEQQRMNTFAAFVQTMEKLYALGESTLPEVAEARHQLYESRLAFLNSLGKLHSIQAQLRHLANTDIQP